MELEGKILGNRYEVIEKIGTGGMATVYKAKCKVLNRNVAIKVLKDEFANDAEFIKRFQVEAQSAASLSHQNIVSIFAQYSQCLSVQSSLTARFSGKPVFKTKRNIPSRLPYFLAIRSASSFPSSANSLTIEANDAISPLFFK